MAKSKNKGEGTFIGLASLFVFAVYCSSQRKNNSPKIFYRKNLINNYNGYILPPFGVFIKESEKDNKALLDHEMVHWKQFQREGLIPFALN